MSHRTHAGRAACLVGACLSLGATSAFAVPVTFEFTGAITHHTTDFAGTNVTLDPAAVGQVVSGSFTIETDGLVGAFDLFDDGLDGVYLQSRYDLTPNSAGTLSIGGQTLDVTGLPYTVAQLEAGDYDSYDLYSVMAGSTSRNRIDPADDVTYSATDRYLSLQFTDPTLGASWFSLTGTETAEDFASWSLGSAVKGYFTSRDYLCTGLNCTPQFQSYYDFSIDSLTRTIGSTTPPTAEVSVPLPPPLALLVPAGLALALRRKLAKSGMQEHASAA